MSKNLLHCFFTSTDFFYWQVLRLLKKEKMF